MISAVVINWNGRPYLEGCIQSLLQQQPPPDEILLVDNHSDDGSREFVEESFPQVRIVDTGDNAGPALARNIGVEQARGKRVLLVDNDVRLQAGALAALDRNLDQHPATACVQARSLCADDPTTVHYDWAEVHYLGLLVLHNWFVPLAEAKDPPAPGTVGGLIALCLLVDRQRYRAVGGFNPALFILFEDTDLALRLRLAGHEIRLEPTAHVLHGAGTEGTSWRSPETRYPARRVFLHSRNRWLVLFTCLRIRTLLVLLPAEVCYGLLQFVFALVKLHPLAWCQGKLAQLRLLARVPGWRKAAQAQRKVTDRELLVGGPLTLNPGVGDRGLGGLVRGPVNACFALYWKLARGLCG